MDRGQTDRGPWAWEAWGGHGRMSSSLLMGRAGCSEPGRALWVSDVVTLSFESQCMFVLMGRSAVLPVTRCVVRQQRLIQGPG